MATQPLLTRVSSTFARARRTTGHNARIAHRSLVQFRDSAGGVIGHLPRPDLGQLLIPDGVFAWQAPPTIEAAPLDTARDEMAVNRTWVRHYDAGVPATLAAVDLTLLDILAETAQRYPDRSGILFYNHRLSYRDLYSSVTCLAASLVAQGVRKGDPVALIMPNCPQFVIAYYAILRIGAIAVPFNPLYTETEVSRQLKDCGAGVVLTLTKFYPTVAAVRDGTRVRRIIVGNIKDYFPPALQALFTVTKEKKEGHRVALRGADVQTWHDALDDFDLPTATAILYAQPTPAPDDIAVYQYTGGTTGVPKAAMLNHRNLATNAAQAEAWLGDMGKTMQTKPQVLVAVIPFFHVYGMTAGMNLTIRMGATMALLPRFVPLDTLKAIARYKPSLFPGVPAMYLALLNHPAAKKYSLKSIKCCMSGAAPLPVETQQRFEELTGARVIEGYGMSEAAPVTHCNPLKGERRIGSIGLPWPGIEARIVDVETGMRDMPTGEIGELVVRAPGVMQGYYNRPDETATAIRDGWLFTGDIARRDVDGFFYIVDRKKDMMLVGGFNVYPRDIEEVLYTHPLIKEAVVVGLPDPKSGSDFVKAYVVLKDAAEESPELAQAITAYCRERLTRYKVPRAVEFRAELPKTLIGKHLRRVLIEEEQRKQTQLV